MLIPIQDLGQIPELVRPQFVEFVGEGYLYVPSLRYRRSEDRVRVLCQVGMDAAREKMFPDEGFADDI